MAQSRSKARLYLGIAGATMALFVGISAALSQGPDRDLTFVREVPVESTREQLDQALGALIQWPQWFYNVAEVQRVDLEGNVYPLSEQKPLNGAHLLLKIDPKKGAHRKFEILTEVTKFEPGAMLELLVIQDSKGKLSRMFDRLTWRVEVIPAQEGQPLRVSGPRRATGSCQLLQKRRTQSF